MFKIGISSCFAYPDPNRAVFSPKILEYIENDMLNYICRKGVLPVLIPNLKDGPSEEIMKELDGFIFQGGADLAPESYGEKPIIEGKWLGDRHRDIYELKVMDFAVKSGKPVLGICRGLQLMNVYFGGTLYQDIATMRTDAIAHRNAELYDKIKHPVKFTKGKLLDNLYGDVENPHVNTVHHQAIKDLGSDLEVLANCPHDDIIEAITYTKTSPGKIMAVQWHPEFSHSLKDEIINPEILLDVFMGFVKEGK